MYHIQKLQSVFYASYPSWDSTSVHHPSPHWLFQLKSRQNVGRRKQLFCGFETVFFCFSSWIIIPFFLALQRSFNVTVAHFAVGTANYVKQATYLSMMNQWGGWWQRLYAPFHYLKFTSNWYFGQVWQRRILGIVTRFRWHGPLRDGVLYSRSWAAV